MEKEIAQRLIDLNARFYQSFAVAFAATRARLQPGVLQVLERIPNDAAILDLGCGNGALAAELVERGFEGRYVGLDFSEGLLEIARENVQSPMAHAGKSPDVEFLLADLTSLAFDQPAEISHQEFDFVLAFALLHHVPGRENRLRLLHQVGARLAPGGRFVHSNWQFLNSERLRNRIQSWEAAGILDEEVDEWDYLLDWRRDGEGLRYVHYFTEEELAGMAAEAGFAVAESFYSDGEGGKLGLYQVWVNSEE